MNRKLGTHMMSVLVLAALLLPAGTAGKTIWTDKNIYSSGENLKAGDIISVQIEDISQMRFTMNLNDSNTLSINSNPDPNLTGFLPKVNANRSVKNNDQTSVSGRGNLNIVIGSRVVRRLNDGKYQIAGTREYSFNGSTSRFTVSGVIDPASVKGGIIRSAEIADFRLEIRGLKEVPGINIARPPLKKDETASPALTEEEKQRIIIEYLNRMLKELGR